MGQYFNYTALSETASGVFTHPFFKTLVAFFIYIGTFLFGTTDIFFSIAVPIALLLILDLKTKLMLAIRDKEISYSILSKATLKLFVYCAYIIMGRIVDHDIPGDYATLLFKSFIIGTECLSITETLGKLGFPLPPKFLKYFKSFTEDGKEIPAQKSVPVVVNEIQEEVKEIHAEMKETSNTVK